MNFIFSIFQRISFFLMQLLAPFRNFQFLLVRLRSFNPLAMIRNLPGLSQIGGMFQRLRYGFSQFVTVPPPIKNFFRRIGLVRGDSKDIPPKAIEKNNYMTYPKPRRGRGINVDDTEETAQIHLVDADNGNRIITHVGMTTGSSESEIVLTSPYHAPVKLGFQQSSPLKSGARIVLRHLAGRVDLTVNNQPVRGDMPIQHKSVIKVDDKVYHCELYESAENDIPYYTRVQAGWVTSVGPQRKINEDAIGIYQHRDAYMFVIADGVGGGEAGELISEFAVKYLLATFHRNIRYNLSWADILRRAIEKVNAEVWHFWHQTDIGKAGTTLTVVVLQQWEMIVAHVGDSRLYHYTNKRFRQVSHDHARPLADGDTNYMDDFGEGQTILTEAIGKAQAIKPQIETIRLQPGDKLLLCTDGLTDYVAEDELRRHLIDLEPNDAAEELMLLANRRDTTDNVSAIVIETLSHGMFWDAWKAQNDERIYAGYTPLSPLRIARDTETDTRYDRVTPVRVANVVLFLIGLAIILRLVL